jgi:hypothetical protein
MKSSQAARPRRRPQRHWLAIAMMAALALPGSASAAPQVKATPDGSKLPGFPEANQLVNGILAFSALATLAAFLVGAGAWALGSLTQNYRAAGAGKTAVLASIVAAILVGSAVAIINFFLAAGPGA